jgi:hypothetical protein
MARSKKPGSRKTFVTVCHVAGFISALAHVREFLLVDKTRRDAFNRRSGFGIPIKVESQKVTQNQC